MTTSLDADRLEQTVKSIYRDVARKPDEEFHFETGRELAERLGYPASDLDRVPQEAIDSFAGVGYHLDLADVRDGEAVLDLGSGAGTDTFVAALSVGDTGSVTGLDMTDEQLERARQLRDDAGVDTLSFEQGYIEKLPFPDGSFDVVISNGVINLSPEKERVFGEANRVLARGGRLALSDIVSEKRLPETIKTDADLWAACIGGAEQIDDYVDLVEAAGFEVTGLRENAAYEFTSEQAQGACSKYGVKSVTLRAEKR